MSYYCNFYYANSGIYNFFLDAVEIKNSNFIYNNLGVYSSGIIKNCEFINNITGIEANSTIIKNSEFINNVNGYSVNHGIIDTCNFMNNTYGTSKHRSGSINFCNFSNNQTGIRIGGSQWSTEPIYVMNSIINSNYIGITEDSVTCENYSYIINCTIDSNSVAGLKLHNGGGSYNDSVINCQIKHNVIGLDVSWLPVIIRNTIEYNTIGIKNSKTQPNIYCNKICNNTNYDFINNSNQSFDISDNYWCTNDSTIVSARIYDGYDNINLGLVSFMPLDTTQCYLITGLKEKEINNISFNIFPNPAYNKLTLILPNNYLQTEVKIYNLIGQLEYISKIENTRTELNILNLTNGIYIIELTINGTIIRKKFCKQ